MADPFGYPMRLRTATKLGYKNPKWVTAIEVTNTYPGGYWELSWLLMVRGHMSGFRIVWMRNVFGALVLLVGVAHAQSTTPGGCRLRLA